jgi:tripartite-type tricarboxylate transporter receptor subunit TctC
MRPFLAVAALVATTMSLLGAPVCAQDAYPTRQVRLVVPTNAGGAPDTLARILAQKLQATYGQPFIVENRSGAANLIGSEFVAKSPADGYTLLLGTTQVFGILPALNPKMPFDAVKDFAPIMRFADAPHLILTRVETPVNDIQEFVKYVAARPGKLSYGSSGIGSSHHLIMEALLDRAGGLKMIHVPFKGSQDNLQAMLGGNLDFAVIAVSSSIRQIKAGKIKPLGLASSNRSKLAPDIVPIAEQGFAGFNLSNWMGLFAPAGTPKPVVGSLEATLMKFFKEPEMSATLEKIGFELAVQGSEEYAKQIRVDLDTYAKVIRSAKVTMEQ